MAHPHIPPPILLLPLHTPQNSSYATLAPRRVPNVPKPLNTRTEAPKGHQHTLDENSPDNSDT